jgi:FkbM family methyltransferase
MGKLDSAKWVFRTQGIAGLMSVIKEHYIGEELRKRVNRWYGKSIENRGNVISIDGCRFSLDSPIITTESKSKFMFNQYEWPERQAIKRFVDSALPVVEFGGSIGVVSCLTNRKLSDPQRHVVVEANPALVPLLLRNRDRNKCEFEVLPRIVAYGSDRAAFYTNNLNFHISTAVPVATDEHIDVIDIETTDLRSILDQYHFDRCTLICDIEGGESDLLRHESEILKDRVATLILEVHEWSLGSQRLREMFDELAALGFQEVFSELDTYAFQKRM